MGQTELKSILIVDDEPDIQTVASLALRSVGGFRVTVCNSGTEAVERASADGPDLILLDVMMPVMDGPATLSALRGDERTARIPVIYMTAKVQSSEVAAYQSQGALGVIPKPFDPMQLSKRVTEIWRGQFDD